MFRVNGFPVQLPSRLKKTFQQFREEGHSITYSLMLTIEGKYLEKVENTKLKNNKQ